MNKYAALGQQIEQGCKWAQEKNAMSYRPRFWKNLYQQICYLVSETWPPIRSRRMKENIHFLHLVLEKVPAILSSFKEYERCFRDWERYNRPRYDELCRIAGEGEQHARREGVRLINELRKELDDLGWPYRKIPEFNALVYGAYGAIYMHAVWTYWGSIKKFLERRSGRR